jgi:hypothetical protein
MISQRGPPGGWGTIKEYEAAEISPGSQNETDGCTVKNKTTVDNRNTIAPIILLVSLTVMFFYLKEYVKNLKNPRQTY